MISLNVDLREKNIDSNAKFTHSSSKGGTGGWTVTIRKLPPSVYSVTHDCWRGMPVLHFDEGHVKKSPYALKELNMKEFYSC